MAQKSLEKFRVLFEKMLHENTFDEILNKLETQKLNDETDIAEVEKTNQLILKLRARNYHMKKKIGLALIRIHEGTFGICQECGQQISEARLLARPTASQCIECKEQIENTERHILYKRRSKTLGKTLQAV
ncbi:MAG: TraR/DksA C4-type zinc finger protein [Halobacteriovoraceae bacterium]|nr:TraR/DksA C4-type zinc finger protein [Halobacteriovoraceae bacterium]